MSILRNLSGIFMPHFERRQSVGLLAALNAEVVHAVNGDRQAVFYLSSGALSNSTYNIQGSVDGVNYFDLTAYPYAPACAGGTIPVSGQPLFSEAVNATPVVRQLYVHCAGLALIRVRLTAYTSGALVVTINSDDCGSLHPALTLPPSYTLGGTVTAAVGVAATLTLPAVAGFRHILNRVIITRSATAALVAAAAPVLVTTTNIPGALVFTFGSDVAGIGIDKTIDYYFNDQATTAINTATTFVAPAYAGVIWRISANYRLGI